MSGFEKHWLKKLTTDYHGLTNVPEPIIDVNAIMFISDGTGGLVNDHFYIKSLTDGIIDVSAASVGAGITGGINVGSGDGDVFRNVSGTTMNLRTLVAGSNITITTNTDDITISSTGGGTSDTSETITTSVSTAVDENIVNTFITIDTGGIVSGTLGNGSALGQKKSILIESISAGGKYRVTVTTLVSTGSILEFDQEGQSVNLKWSSSGWILNGGSGAVVL